MRSIKTKNFSTNEVIHRPLKISEELYPIGYIAQGMLQGFRNYLCLSTGRNIRLTVTSGYREREYNETLPGSAKNSYHIWRYGEDEVIWAVDIWSQDLTQDELYEYAAKFFNGEVYKHGHLNLVHVSDSGPNEDLGSLG